MTSKCRRLFAWKNHILKGFTLWPTIVAILFLGEEWVFFYNITDIPHFFIFIFISIFSAVCLIWALVSLIRKKPKSFVSFFFPALFLISIFSPWGAPIRDRFFDFRHYVEFQIQKKFYFPEMNDPNKLPPYKEWPIKETRNINKFTIVYDLKGSLDEREKKKRIIMEHDCGYSVTKLGNHFYMLTEYYIY